MKLWNYDTKKQNPVQIIPKKNVGEWLSQFYEHSVFLQNSKWLQKNDRFSDIIVKIWNIFTLSWKKYQDVSHMPKMLVTLSKLHQQPKISKRSHGNMFELCNHFSNVECNRNIPTKNRSIILFCFLNLSDKRITSDEHNLKCMLKKYFLHYIWALLYFSPNMS